MDYAEIEGLGLYVIKESGRYYLAGEECRDTQYEIPEYLALSIKQFQDESPEYPEGILSMVGFHSRTYKNLRE